MSRARSCGQPDSPRFETPRKMLSWLTANPLFLLTCRTPFPNQLSSFEGHRIGLELLQSPSNSALAESGRARVVPKSVFFGESDIRGANETGRSGLQRALGPVASGPSRFLAKKPGLGQGCGRECAPSIPARERGCLEVSKRLVAFRDCDRVIGMADGIPL